MEMLQAKAEGMRMWLARGGGRPVGVEDERFGTSLSRGERRRAPPIRHRKVGSYEIILTPRCHYPADM